MSEPSIQEILRSVSIVEIKRRKPKRTRRCRNSLRGMVKAAVTSQASCLSRIGKAGR